MDYTMDKVIGHKEGMHGMRIRDVIEAIDKDKGYSELRQYLKKAPSEERLK